MGDVGRAYAGCRARIDELVRPLEKEQASVAVPTCPGWSVHDVVAHLSGVVDDALAGRLDGVGTDPWTAAQVEARRDRDVPSMLAEWEQMAPAFQEMLDVIGAQGRQAVADAVTHEHDVRVALGRPGARESDAVRIGLSFVAPALVAAAADRGTSLQVRATDGTTFGEEDASVVLTGESFELLRAMTGRRSARQLRGMRWDGDAEALAAAFEFGPFRPPADDVEE